MYKCKECDKEFTTRRLLSIHIKKHNLSNKDYYDKWLKKDGEGICQNCGKPTRFYKLWIGYQKYCSKECQYIKGVQNWRKTMNEKYNGGYYSGTAEYKEKIRNKCLNKYGCDYYWQAEEIKEKRRLSLLKHFGVEHTMQDLNCKKLAKAHREATNLKRYGVKHNWASEELRIKGQYSTSLKRYGVKHFTNATKAKETMLKKYGVDWYTKTKEYKDRAQKTSRLKYGVPFALQNSEIRKKGLQKFTSIEGKHYDSRWEYLFEKYLIDNSIIYEYQPTTKFKWKDIDGKTHVYIPDFAITTKEGIKFIEIKGDHFFDKKGNFIDPYNKNSKKAQLNAKLKWEYMMKIGVNVYTSKDLKALGINIRNKTIK